MKQKGEDQIVTAERVCKCTITLEALHRDNSNPDQPSFTLQLKIFPAALKPPIETTATGRDWSTPRGWKEWLLSRAGINFEGSTQAATALTTLLTSSKAPEVTRLTTTGYDKETGWYVYKNFAVDQLGKIHQPTKQAELYRISGQQYLKSASHAADKAIRAAETGPTVAQLHQLITGAWGPRGAIGFAWMVASWFVNQIKADLNFFPFLSFWGSPTAGKSALTTILQACQGLDTEGLPITGLNSKKGLARSIARVSGLFTALLEDNRRENSTFDYSILLTAYNSGQLQIQAAFSGDNRTKEAPFLGSLLFVQNTEPFASQAERERVISVKFDIADLTDQTRPHFEKLSRIPKQQLARVIVQILQQRSLIEQGWRTEYEKAVELLAPVNHARIASNHALVLAFHTLICRLFGINCDLDFFIHELAKEKVITSQQRIYDQADRFFESLSHLEYDKITSCIHMDKDKGLLYVNLPGVEEQLRNAGINLYASDQTTGALTRHPAFVKNSHRYRFPNDPQKDKVGQPKMRRVWVFDVGRI